MTEQTIQEGKTIAIVAYLTIIGAVIAAILNNDKKNPFATFHVRQGLGLCITYMVFGFFIGQFDSLNISYAFWIGFGVLFFFGLFSAISGKMQEVPLLGPIYQKLFAKLIN